MGRLAINIALATYNGAAYLPEQLESFTRQERLPDALVITDDCSTDATAEVVENFARNSPFPVNFGRNSERLGFNGNFARAISLCDSDVILFSDQDDVWLPTHVGHLAAAFESDPKVSVAASNSKYTDEHLNPSGTDLWTAARVPRSDRRRLMRRWQFRFWARQRFVLGHGMGIRAELRDKALPLVASWNFDDWFAILGAAFGRAVVVDEALSLHRHHPSQSVGHHATSLVELHSQTPFMSAEYFDTQIRAWQDLLNRVRQHRADVVDPRVIQVIDGRLAFLQFRRDLRSKSPVGRSVSATASLFADQYHAHARGWLTYGRDILG
jgi:glycosyltransferase involved in cell wall biosynthesis